MPLSSPTTSLYPPLTLTPQVSHANQTHSQLRRLNSDSKTSSVSTSQQKISSRGRYERHRSQRSLIRWIGPNGLQVCRKQLDKLHLFWCEPYKCQSVESQFDKCKLDSCHPCRCRHGSLYTRWMQSRWSQNTSQHSATSAVQLQGYRKCG